MSRSTLDDLRRLAYVRLFSAGRALQDEFSSEAKVELYHSHCYLSSDNPSTVSLADLELEGSLAHPLDIFVVLVPSASTTSRPLPGVFGFETTQRGVATFHTCLKIFFEEIDCKNNSLENALEVLWELTHFPPSLLAFKDLHDCGVDKAAFSAAVLAQCFRELSRKMVPPWISSDPTTILESSRLVFAWLCALRSEASTSFGRNQQLVHQVELRDLPVDPALDSSTDMPFKNEVEVPLAVGASGSSTKKVRVCMASEDHAKPKLLALALNGSYQSRWNHYFFPPAAMSDWLDHKRVASLHPADFDNLLVATNDGGPFQMFGPLQLADCSSGALPVITLSEGGFVSVYDQRDHLCERMYFFTWNVVEREKTMADANPGQYLLQKLEPIVMQRKKDQSWEVDAWTDTINDVFIDGRTPDEAVVICVDISPSMASSMPQGWVDDGTPVDDALSRLSEVKDVFKNLATRFSAYKLAVHLGLVTFSGPSKVTVKQEVTPVLLNFRDQLELVRSQGDTTAIWDGLHKAYRLLAAFKAKHPKTKCRIIVLTDGEDNNSENLPSQVCKMLYETDIVLDAVVIGTTATTDLFRMAKHTGGYAFRPTSRAHMYQIFGLEPFIDVRMRPDIVKMPFISFRITDPKTADMPNMFVFPPCRPHPNEDDHFIALRDAGRYLAKRSSPANGAGRGRSRIGSPSSWSNASTTESGESILSGTTVGASGLGRVALAEVKAMIDHPHQYMDVYVSENNMGFWKIVMQGPPASAYEKGTFLLSVDLGGEFPRKAPSVRFITPVLHPNVTKSQHGRICHPIFDREWTPATHVYEVLQQIYGILMSLETHDAIDPFLTLQYWTDAEAIRSEVEQYVATFAQRSRHLICAEIENGGPLSASEMVAHKKRKVVATSP
ncbi:MAG: hypothetical protein M1826_002225 [Phylliscum demangeonii]|nr:MAG: hypothetical protein M1826_002225 [Phylliscum demangeonii]